MWQHIDTARIEGLGLCSKEIDQQFLKLVNFNSFPEQALCMDRKRWCRDGTMTEYAACGSSFSAAK
ncbi:hypothetical protein M514_18350 [Trichuris suis]|uniref:Uncharacterized protein n=1 Tax=Trichuris suis TaxID=68888 RepID=A0A085NJ32_9BILA|nr:hypothetical protein M514_18350 [Trichuris suis]